MRLCLQWGVDSPLSAVLWREVNDTCIAFLSKSHLILDVGCGSSDFLSQLPSERIIGLDIRHEYIVDSASENRVVASAYCLPFREMVFDGIHCRAVVHHLEAGKFLKELSAVCSSESAVCIIEPVQGILTRILRRLVTSEYHEAGEHPLADNELGEIRKHVRVEVQVHPFGELAYLLIFVVPKLPEFMRPFLRWLSLKVFRVQKALPFPPAYVFILGRIG